MDHMTIAIKIKDLSTKVTVKVKAKETTVKVDRTKIQEVTIRFKVNNTVIMVYMEQIVTDVFKGRLCFLRL